MADERLSIFNRIKVFFATIGSIGVGAFIVWGPAEVIDDIRDEMSDQWRIGVGIGFMTFGALLGLTGLFASGSSPGSQALAARFKGLLFAAVATVILGAILLTFGKDVQLAWRLAEEGKATTASVTRRNVHRTKDSTRYSYSIEYDNHRAKISLYKTPGKTVPVVYLPSDPKTVMAGTAEDGVTQLIERKRGRWPAIGFVAAGLACIVVIPFGLKRFVLGKPPGETELTG